MRILVFENSDTRGAVVDCPTWPELARQRLAEIDGEEVEIVDRSFVPLGKRAPEIAETAAREAGSDVIFLPLSEYAFWARTVEWRIQRHLGKRVARWFKEAERGIDRGAKKTGSPGNATKKALRSVARKVIGRGALASPGEVTATYRETLSRLARIEDVDVVVVAYPVSPVPAMSEPRMAAARARFIADVKAEALARRFRWVEGDRVIERAGLSPAAAYHTDRTHIGEPCHALFAAAIVAAMRAPSTASAGQD